MDRVEVGNRLRTFLIEKYGKLKIGADKIGMTSAGLNMYLNGKRSPGAKVLAKLSEIGCDIDWLLLVKDDRCTSIRSEGGKKVIYEICTGEGIENLALRDKVIINQAEEIMMLRDELKNLRSEIKENKKSDRNAN